ncbi:MAG: hypothetical protein AABX11_04830 [Nanoarchaeota archaeon]
MQKKDELAILSARISNGRQHKLSFMALEDIAKPVAQITDKINKSLTKEEFSLRLREVSRSLKWLADINLAFSPNFESKHGVKGIVYRLAPKGKALRKFIERDNS